MKELSKQTTVTILRALYPIWMATGIFSLIYVPSTLIIRSDATTTAANIIANEFLFRAGIAGSLITQLIYIIVVLLLYRLFETVNKNQSILMVVLALVAVPIAMLNILNDLGALLQVSNPVQMMLFIELSKQGTLIAQIFWGLWLFPLGYLIYQSRYFPKVIGIVVIIGGFGYILLSFIAILFPNSTTLLSIFDVMTIGEVVFIAWLIFLGAKLPKKST
ncbi:MAG: DUF4386 domain-containing protein [Cyclobacteriaceae bacterium]|nr:DUF4386 domain-containing protein [Cyclobacteriaceae bacterium]